MDRNMGDVIIYFSGIIYWLYDSCYVANPSGISPTTAMIKYITGYLIELSLSVDNIFVIAIIFASFKIPKNISIGFYFGVF